MFCWKIKKAEKYKCNLKECTRSFCIFKEKHNAKSCSKCNERTDDLTRNYPSENVICNLCSQISLTGCISMNGVDEWYFIWHDSIEEKGIEWYKKARNKLIKRFEQQKKQQEKKEKQRKKKMIEKIEKW